MEKCIEQFMLDLHYATEYLKMLSLRTNITVWISAFPEGEQCNVHLSEKTLAVICKSRY